MRWHEIHASEYKPLARVANDYWLPHSRLFFLDHKLKAARSLRELLLACSGEVSAMCWRHVFPTLIYLRKAVFRGVFYIAGKGRSLFGGGGDYKLGVGLFLYLSIGRRTGESFIIPHMGARQESVGLADASARLTRESFIIFILKLYYVNCDAKYIHRVQDEDVHHGDIESGMG